MASRTPGQSIRLVLGSLVALLLVLGILLILDSKKVESPGVAEQPAPRAPSNAAPGTTESPR